LCAANADAYEYGNKHTDAHSDSDADVYQYAYLHQYTHINQ
jgi:hypothetical protein